MAPSPSSSFTASWFYGTEAGEREQEHRVRAYVRLWRAFMRARVLIALVLLSLQLFALYAQSGGPRWLLPVSALHLCATFVLLFWPRVITPEKPVRLQWVMTLGVDLLVFALLQGFQQGSISYTPLFALPVLLASVLGTMTLALATAAGVTLFVLGDAVLGAELFSEMSTSSLLQAGLTGTGFFVIAFLANQLAQRLAREEAVAQSSQAAARTQAQVNELVIESLSEGVMVVDQHGWVLNANPAAQNILMGDAYQRHASHTLLSAHRGWQELAALVAQTFANGQGLDAEARIEIDNGITHRYIARTRLTGSHSGRPHELCVLFLEDQREVEARLRTEKLASMGRMSAAVAHEIRNPLSAITQANALLDEEVSEPGQKRLTHMIEQNAQRLSRVVEDILNVARAQHSPDETVPALPLDQTVRLIAREWIGQQSQSPSILSVHTHAEGVLIAFDPDHLRRLLINLLDNALRYASARPSSIRVITQPHNADLVRLSVWSDGVPLEAGVQRHLFEPFFSSESRSSGLGLYICRELCERCGASIAYQRRDLDQLEGNEFYVLATSLGRATTEPEQLSFSHTTPGDRVVTEPLSLPGLLPGNLRHPLLP